jgi:hypothetical protein
MAISEVGYGGLIAVDQGAWRLKGIRMRTSHRLDRRTSNSAASQFDTRRLTRASLASAANAHSEEGEEKDLDGNVEGLWSW